MCGRGFSDLLRLSAGQSRMNWNHRPKKILITGKSGSGKSSLFLFLLLGSYFGKRTVKFIFDPDLEFSRKLKITPARTLDDLHLALKTGLVCFDPAEMFPGDFPAAFAFFSRWVLAVSQQLKGAKLLAVDEIQKFTRPGRGGVPPAFQEILDIGRRHEIDLLIIAQRVNQVNDAIRGQLTDIITFQHTDRLPLAWLEEDGFNPETVKALQFPGGHIWRNVETSTETTHEPNENNKPGK